MGQTVESLTQAKKYLTPQACSLTCVGHPESVFSTNEGTVDYHQK